MLSGGGLVSDPVSADEGLSLAARVYSSVHLTGKFTLRLGGTSTEFFDHCSFQAEPAMLREIAENLAPLVPADTEVVAGPDLGGVPIATMLSQVVDLPAAWVRKVAKDYGPRKLAEGAEVAGRRVVVVEPFVKTGNFALELCADLRRLDAHIAGVLCVIDFQRGGPELLAAAGYKFAALFTLDAAAEAYAQSVAHQ